MAQAGMRIQNVRYDATEQCYYGAVTFIEANGIHIFQVSAPGMSSWGYERTLQALGDAGRRARRAARHPRSHCTSSQQIPSRP